MYYALLPSSNPQIEETVTKSSIQQTNFEELKKSNFDQEAYLHEL